MEMFIDFARRRQFWVAFILIVFLSFIIFKTQTKADLAYFYPQTCLGSFVNPEKAQGEREVESTDLINESNSAVYYSGFKEIYCGNFQGPIKEGEIKKVTLHFNWVITKELKEKPIIESTSSESLIEKIIPSKTIEINVGTSDVQILENNTNSNESNNTNTNSNEINNMNSNELGTSTQTTSTFATSSKTLFDIHYTLDGQNWNYLGSVNENNWQNLSFDIPVVEASLRYGTSPEVGSGTRPEVGLPLLQGRLDISKIQIKINSLPDTDQYLYLESMWLEVEHENPQATSTFQTLTGEMVGTIISPFISNETTTTTQEKGNSAETSQIIEPEATTTVEEAVPATTTEESKPIIQEPLKIRKFEKMINIKNLDNLSCFSDQFSINIKEGEIKFINFKLKGEGMKNLEIGSLPSGIDIVFAENNDYQISTNNDIVQLKIYRQKGSEKGNFSLPIIFNSKKSNIICQINVITN